MMFKHRRLGVTVMLPLTACTFHIHGCGTTGQTTWLHQKAKESERIEQVALVEDPKPESAAIRDTIQTVAWLEGVRKMSVGGYGLVVGLGKNGTRQCPRPIREYMLKDLRSRYRLGAESDELQHLLPEKLIDSEETAVVTVYGEIPAAVSKGATFDLSIRVLEGTDARSLEGGWLMPCSLKLWADGQPVEGRILGEGAGPVFINPFGLREGAATKVDPREGRVIGGGRSSESRRIRLVLNEPSGPIASRLANLVNQRFGMDPVKPGEAASPAAVDLRVPLAWHGRESHFLELMMHLYVPSAPSFGDLRLRELDEEAVKPDAPLEDIALAWEGLGKSCIQHVRKLYAHTDNGVSYYAARAGLRTGDDLAVEVMARHLRDPADPFREMAIEELGRATDISRAVLLLRPMLDDEDQRIRRLAYEGLRRHGDGTVRTIVVGKKNFTVDVVSSTGKFLITARRSGQQRITIFGTHVRCNPPLFYAHHADLVTITANPGDMKMKIVRRTPLTGRRSSVVQAPLDLPGLIQTLGRDPEKDANGHYEGLGLSYSQIVEILHDLCAKKALDATFVLQEIDKAEVNPKYRDSGRPESEL